MTTLAAVHGVVPTYRYPQSELTAEFADLCGVTGDQSSLLRRFHGNAGVEFRHLAYPLERYREFTDLGATNDAYLAAAVDLGTRAVAGALDQAGIELDDVDLIISTTITGIAVPSLDARIAGHLGLRPDVVRVPMFGLGCVAGAAGIARLHDYLLGQPDKVAVLLAVELCSLTIQRDDRSPANLVASGLFGDGAAAVVAVGSDRAATSSSSTGPQVIAARSHLYPDSERAMGWDLVATGLRIVLDAGVPELISKYLGGDLRAFLAEHGLSTSEVTCWVSHPGGPKVIDAICTALDLPASAVALTTESLAKVGNLSSASVLHVLADTIAEHPPPGSVGVLMAFGPGFCSELVLLRW